MATKIFENKKIIIRKLSAKDIKQPEKFQKYVNSFIEEDAMLLINTKKSKKDELEWLKSIIKQLKKKKRVSLFAEYKGLIVGGSHIESEIERKNHIGGFGIAIKRGFRGIGLGEYLMKEVIELAKKELKSKPKIIELGVYEGNIPAFKLYKKIGFKQVAKIPKHIQYKGKLIAEIIMQLEL